MVKTAPARPASSPPLLSRWLESVMEPGGTPLDAPTRGRLRACLDSLLATPNEGEDWDWRELHLQMDRMMVRLDERLAACLQGLMNHPRFLELRSIWLGLYSLVDSGSTDRHVEIDLLSVRKAELAEDFENYLDLSQSGLFFHLYKSEYDQAGGKPYSSVLMQYEFDHSPGDVHLLRQVSMVASSSHSPVITNASPTLFGVRNFKELDRIVDFDLLFESRPYTKWQSFRQRQETRYLALVLPRWLVTQPLQRRPPRFCRLPILKHSDLCWTQASYAFGKLMIRSFSKFGWYIYLRGPRTGGLVADIQGPSLGDSGYELDEIPLEIYFSDRQEQDLAGRGFVPLTYYRAEQKICLYSAPTLQASEQGRVAGADDRLAASMPYLFLITRIAHFQKSIQRDFVGVVSEKTELERALQQWLKGLIKKIDDPDLLMRSRYPLRDGLVRVEDVEEAPGFFNVNLVIQPHIQLEGVNAQLTLVSKMPRKE